jgi:uncharacterized protein
MPRRGIVALALAIGVSGENDPQNRHIDNTSAWGRPDQPVFRLGHLGGGRAWCHTAQDRCCAGQDRLLGDLPMETEFTPWASLAGGALIGLAAVLLMALHGRILGATGILGGLLRLGDMADWGLRAALVLGMVAAPLAVLLTTGQFPVIDRPMPTAAVALGGLIVGIGVSYGGGCTSGHGVCGIARFSRRSIVATASFMVTAILTVFVLRHGV